MPESKWEAPQAVAKSKENDISLLPEILDGKEAAGLAVSARRYKFTSEEIVVAGTDKGINYKDHNEDRVAVSPNKNFIAVIDGLGGHLSGELAAEILAKSLLKSTDNPAVAAVQARKEMAEQGMEEGGAVFISAELRVESGRKFLNVSQVGDAKLVVIKKTGEIVFESEDESLVQELVKLGAVTPDEALYHPKGNIVSQSVNANPLFDVKVKFYPPIAVENGDLIFLMSDGISDNLIAEEIALKVKQERLSVNELFLWLSDETTKRMENVDKIIKNSNRRENGVYSDGYKSKPKKDNRALAILEIK